VKKQPDWLLIVWGLQVITWDVCTCTRTCKLFNAMLCMLLVLLANSLRVGNGNVLHFESESHFILQEEF